MVLVSVLMYHSVERFCSDLCQVYFAVHLFVNLTYDRSAMVHMGKCFQQALASDNSIVQYHSTIKFDCHCIILSVHYRRFHCIIVCGGHTHTHTHTHTPVTSLTCYLL